MAVLSLHGISPSLATSNSDGTAQRESWRRLLSGVIEPLSRIVATELSAKLDTPGVRFTFDDLRANDLATQARSWRMLAGKDAAMDTARADALVKFND